MRRTSRFYGIEKAQSGIEICCFAYRENRRLSNFKGAFWKSSNCKIKRKLSILMDLKDVAQLLRHCASNVVKNLPFSYLSHILKVHKSMD